MHDWQHVLYLNWRFYLGRSFGQWFASYSVWGAVPATIILVALGYSFP